MREMVSTAAEMVRRIRRGGEQASKPLSTSWMGTGDVKNGGDNKERGKGMRRFQGEYHATRCQATTCMAHGGSM